MKLSKKKKEIKKELDETSILKLSEASNCKKVFIKKI